MTPSITRAFLMAALVLVVLLGAVAAGASDQQVRGPIPEQARDLQRVLSGPHR